MWAVCSPPSLKGYRIKNSDFRLIQYGVRRKVLDFATRLWDNIHSGGKNMTSQFIRFGSIEQFRHVVTNLTHAVQYRQNEDGTRYYDTDIPLPTLKGYATEKVHGTNAAVCMHKDQLWVQSRTKIITPENDNHECAAYVEVNKAAWKEIIQKYVDWYKIDLEREIISIFFEWSGGNIQKNSCVSGLTKRAFIFDHFKISWWNGDNELTSKWFSTPLFDRPDCNIYNIGAFPRFQVKLDFNDLETTKERINQLVSKVESSSGIAKEFGVPDNVGEGVVITFQYNNITYRFKAKGEKHNVTKVRKLKVDPEKESAAVEFANYACSASRLEQALQTVGPDIRKTGNFIKAVMLDIIKEEYDLMEQKNLTTKDFSSHATKIARNWFMEQL